MTDVFNIHRPFPPAGDQPQAIEALRQGLAQGLLYQTLLGVTGSGKTYTIANVIQAVQRPALVLAPNKTLAAQFYAELREFFPQNAVEYFVSYYDYYQPEAYVPSSDTYIEKDASINDHIEQMRLSATKSLLERPDTIIVATVSAIYGLGDPKSYLKMVMSLRCGDLMDHRSLLRRLAELQYTRNDTILQRAMYRVHGDVIDVFPADSEHEAIRIELFDERIERIQVIDPLNNRVLRKLQRITIFPKTHYVTPRQTILDTVEKIKIDLKKNIKAFKATDKLLEAQRLEQRTQFDIEMMLELGYCTGIENYSRYLSGRSPGDPPPTLMEYLPDNAFLIIDESHVTVPQLGGMYRGDRARKENLVNYGFRLPVALDNRPLRFDEFERLSPQTIFVSATPGSYEKSHESQVVRLFVRPTGLLDPAVEIRPVNTQVDDLLSEIQKRVTRKERVLVTTLTKRMAEDLTEYYVEQGIRVRYLHSDIDTVERVDIIRDLRLGVFDVLIGINLLREGLDLPEVSLVAILDADKEGFLRSERSLIQTIGRAARHLAGCAILYADKVTRSMQAAIEETQRRRDIQHAFNREHGIIPRGIQKAVNDILDGVHRTHATQPHAVKEPVIEEAVADYLALSPKQRLAKIRMMERRMLDCAKNLEFEEAAHLRDKISHLRKITLD